MRLACTFGYAALAAKKAPRLCPSSRLETVVALELLLAPVLVAQSAEADFMEVTEVRPPGCRCECRLSILVGVPSNG